MNDSDFAIGFKQGQEHGKQIILEKIDDIRAEIDNHISDFIATDIVLQIIDKHIRGDADD